MIILVNGDSLDIKELTYAIIIIINFFILIGFKHIYYRHLYTFMYIRHIYKYGSCFIFTTGPQQINAYSLQVLLFID